MASINGVNFAKEFVNDPSEQGAIGEMGGRVKCMYDSIASSNPADDLSFGKIPAGARILRLSYVGDGTSAPGDFNIAVDDKLSVETTIICTLPVDQTPATASACFAEYILD